MRHRSTKLTLGRKTEPRVAMLRGLVNSLITTEGMTTTEAKAKAVKPIVEKLVTKAKNNTLASKRKAVSYLYTKDSIKNLFDVLAPRFMARKGGYLRIIKLGFRKGDGAKMARIEFLEK